MKFRRQHGIGPYIADFYSPECRLVVELDGAAHANHLPERTGDSRIRFENRTVFESLELVLNSIRISLQEGLTAPPRLSATPYSTQRMIEVRVLLTVAAGPVVTVGKPERFLRRLFQAAVEIFKKKLPEASFVDFRSCGSFHRFSFSFLALFSFSLE